MRKRLIPTTAQDTPQLDEGWLDLDSAATVEVTSEEKDYPVELAFISGELRGRRAAPSGAQTVRLIFDKPQSLTRIALVFEENETARTQEFVLRWSADGGNSFREIVRQQWNFSPPHTTRLRSRNLRFNSRMSPFSNWASCPTSVEEQLAPRSGVTSWYIVAKNDRTISA